MLLLLTAIVVVGVVMAATVSVSGMRAQQARMAAYEKISRERAQDASKRAAIRTGEIQSQIESERAYLRDAHERAEHLVRPLQLSVAARAKALNEAQADSEARVRAYLERVHDMLGTRTATLRADFASVTRKHDMDVANRLDPYQTLTELKTAVGFSNRQYTLSDFQLADAASSTYPSTLRQLASVADEYLEQQSGLRDLESSLRDGIRSASESVVSHRLALSAGAAARTAEISALATTGLTDEIRALGAAAGSEARALILAASVGAASAVGSVLSVSDSAPLYRIAAEQDNAAHLLSAYASQTSNYMARVVNPHFDSANSQYAALVTDLSVHAAATDRAVSVAFQTGVTQLASVSAAIQTARDALVRSRTQLAEGAGGVDDLYVRKGAMASALATAISAGSDHRGLAEVVIRGLEGKTVRYRDVRTAEMESLNAYASGMESVAAQYESIRPRWRDFFAPSSNLPDADGARVLVSELVTDRGGTLGQTFAGGEYRMTFPPNAKFAGVRVVSAGTAVTVPMHAFGTAWGEYETQPGLSAQVATRATVQHVHAEFVPAASEAAVVASVASAMNLAIRQARPTLASTVTSVPIGKISLGSCAAAAVPVRVQGLQDTLRGAPLVAPTSVPSSNFHWNSAPEGTKLFDMSAITVPMSDLIPSRILSVQSIQFTAGGPKVPARAISLPTSFGRQAIVSDCAGFSNVYARTLSLASNAACTLSANNSNSCSQLLSNFTDPFSNVVKMHLDVSNNRLAFQNEVGGPVFDFQLNTGAFNNYPEPVDRGS